MRYNMVQENPFCGNNFLRPQSCIRMLRWYWENVLESNNSKTSIASLTLAAENTDQSQHEWNNGEVERGHDQPPGSWQHVSSWSEVMSGHVTGHLHPGDADHNIHRLSSFFILQWVDWTLELLTFCLCLNGSDQLDAPDQGQENWDWSVDDSLGLPPHVFWRMNHWVEASDWNLENKTWQLRSNSN